MKYAEAIETIKANYPPENYSALREALNIAIELLKGQNYKDQAVDIGYLHDW